jgi:hypothetical protein
LLALALALVFVALLLAGHLLLPALLLALPLLLLLLLLLAPALFFRHAALLTLAGLLILSLLLHLFVLLIRQPKCCRYDCNDSLQLPFRSRRRFSAREKKAPLLVAAARGLDSDRVY